VSALALYHAVQSKDPDDPRKLVFWFLPHRKPPNERACLAWVRDSLREHFLVRSVSIDHPKLQLHVEPLTSEDESNLADHVQLKFGHAIEIFAA